MRRLTLVVCVTAVAIACGRSPLQPESAAVTNESGPSSSTAASVMAPNRAPVPVASSITLDRPSSSVQADALWPRLGDTVTFSSTYSSKLEHYGIRIQLMCRKADGEVIYGEAGPHDQPFLLGGGMSLWLMNGGDPSCQADLYYWSYQGGQQTFNPLASTTFAAYGR